MCGRPKDFEWIIMENTRKHVNDNDVLIHTGDFCLDRPDFWHNEFINHCPGKKWLVLGNHDKKSLSWYIKRGWDFVGTELSLFIHGKNILFSHKPLQICDRYDINIHGHLHNSGHRDNFHDDDKHVLIKCEHEYKPVNLRGLCGQ